MSLHFSLLGVPVTVRPTALGTGLLSSLIVALVTRKRRSALSVAAGVLWYSVDCVHVVGHIVSSRMADAPMDGIDFGLYPKSVYLNHDVSPQQHLGRAAGGPITSLIAALILGALARTVRTAPTRQLLTLNAAQHGILLVLSMLPLPMVDGGVIYTNLRKLRR